MSVWEDRAATPEEAMREWVWEVGRYPENINSQWLVHDWDVVLLNPHYHGLPQRHPNDDSEGPGQEELFTDGTWTGVYDDGNWGRNRH